MPDPDPEPVQPEPEATWTEFTSLYLDLLKWLHISEWDREEKPCVYTGIVPSRLYRDTVSPYPTDTCDGHNDDDESDDTPDYPLAILTCYYIHTHKGIYHQPITTLLNSTLFQPKSKCLLGTSINPSSKTIVMVPSASNTTHVKKVSMNSLLNTTANTFKVRTTTHFYKHLLTSSLFRLTV